MKPFLFAAMLALVSPVAASALDLPVTYDVDSTALKAAVAGTSLTFSVHTDSACATPAVLSQAIDVQDVQSIEVLKRFTPKGAPKAPKTARMTQVLASVPAQFSYYVSVTGTGITPVGGACQPQFATPASGVAGSVPAGFLSLTGPYTPLATLALTVPANGTLVLAFETELNAYAADQYLTCAVFQDLAFVDSFEMDTGDRDVPIPAYDLRQSWQRAIAVTAGPHTYEVQCSLPFGVPVDTYGSRLLATYHAAGL